MRDARVASKYRASLIEAYTGFRLAGEGPPPIEAQLRRVLALEGLGFQYVISQVTESGAHLVYMYRERDSSLAEIAEFGNAAPGLGVVVEITSELENHRALLCTGTNVVLSFHPAELRQSFPNADAAGLVANHEAAVEYLTDRGLTPASIGAPDILDLRARWFDRQLTLLKAATRAELLLWIRDAQAGHPTSAGPIAENPVMVERVSAILDGR